MFTPESFKENDAARLRAIIHDYPFAPIISGWGDDIEVTHLPFMLDTTSGDHGTLVAHMARANPHWRRFDGEREALVIFTGPHAYISPSWYEKPTEVPTWNYAVVHVSGRPRIVTDKRRVRAMLETLVAAHESRLATRWTTNLAGNDYREEQMDYIVAFEMPIKRVVGKFKLSQNRSPNDRAGVILALAASARESDRATAELMSLTNGLPNC